MKKRYELNRLYRVVGYEKQADEKILRRLLEFGFTKNTTFKISHKSLIGKSVIVELRGYFLTMRKKFLELLKVE